MPELCVEPKVKDPLGRNGLALPNWETKKPKTILLQKWRKIQFYNYKNDTIKNVITGLLEPTLHYEFLDIDFIPLGDV